LAVLWTGFTWHAAVLALALYVQRMFAVTAGYHRYFAHHRRHHRYSDTVYNVHSSVQCGFFYARLGWIFVARNDITDFTALRDLASYPELRWLDQHPYLPASPDVRARTMARRAMPILLRQNQDVPKSQAACKTTSACIVM
jgi:stearoyl-CoA desaturase (delta-9 desaturase)